MLLRPYIELVVFMPSSGFGIAYMSPSMVSEPGTENLHNNDDTDKTFSTKNSTRKIYGKKVPPESLMTTHVFEGSKEIFKM